jgi:hypothetical protein
MNNILICSLPKNSVRVSWSTTVSSSSLTGAAGAAVATEAFFEEPVGPDTDFVGKVVFEAGAADFDVEDGRLVGVGVGRMAGVDIDDTEDGALDVSIFLLRIAVGDDEDDEVDSEAFGAGVGAVGCSAHEGTKAFAEALGTKVPDRFMLENFVVLFSTSCSLILDDAAAGEGESESVCVVAWLRVRRKKNDELRNVRRVFIRFISIR